MADFIVGSTATALRAEVEGISQAQAALLLFVLCLGSIHIPLGGILQLRALASSIVESIWERFRGGTDYFTVTTTSVKSSSKAPLQKLVASRLSVSSISAAVRRMFSFPIRATLCSPNSTPLELRASVKPSV